MKNLKFLMIKIRLAGPLFFAATLSLVNSSHANEFHFVTLGDTAYKDGRLEEYGRLIKTINKSEPTFSIHVGDMTGYQACDREVYERVKKEFNSFQSPLIYTPGDNEWTDCWDPAVTPKDKNFNAVQTQQKLGTLNMLREMFFAKPESLGKTKLKLTRQSDILAHKDYVENVYWEHNGVLFATVHVVGSNDGLDPYLSAAAEESIERRISNMMWLDHLRKKVEAEQPKAVVIAMHAALFTNEPTRQSMQDNSNVRIRGGKSGPYAAYVQRIANFAKNYKRPILLIHGDFHEYVIDRPFYLFEGESNPDNMKGENITRLQVFGSPELKAVKVTVEPDTPWVFGFTPLF